ncbi:MAG: vWA domain-containing protein, partial [Desulfomonilaceae bacterium]
MTSNLREFPLTNSKPHLFCFTAVFALVFGLLSDHCFAGGLFHVFTPTIDGTLCPVARPSCLVSNTVVTVSESYVEVNVDQVFLNDNDYSLDSVFILPLAPKGPYNVSEVLINGENAVFDVVKSGELFPMLKKIACETQEPACLGLCGYDAIVCPKIKIGIKESKSFRITYRVPFNSEDDILDLKIPMVGERYAMNPLGEYKVLARFKMSRAVRTSLCTSNYVLTENESRFRRLIVCNQPGVRSPEDFRLVTTFGGPDLNFRVLSQKTGPSEGYFMTIVEPPQIRKSDEPPFSDIAILLDRSSSVGSENLDLSKKAVALMLAKLRPKDRFDLICFASRPKRMFEGFVGAIPKNLSLAMNCVETSKSSGGTDLYNTLLMALDLFQSRKRPGMILLVTDGKATVGKTSPETLVEMVRHYNKSRTRIFIIAMGTSADVATLDTIARISGGAILQVSKPESFESIVSAWLSSNMMSPGVTGFSVDFKGLSGKSFVPDPIPDMIGRDGIAILGKYSPGTSSGITVTIKGKIGRKLRELSKKVNLSTQQKSYDFIPALWAMRKMA